MDQIILNPYELTGDINYTALVYAHKGARVFPLAAGFKNPALRGSWLEHATSDQSIINSWFSGQVNGRQYNLGMATGEPSEITAIDLDIKDGKDGWASYQAVCPGPFNGPIVQTPTGGYHLYVQYDERIPRVIDKGAFGGIDICTTGNFVVLPTSRLVDATFENGKVQRAGTYQLLQGGPIQPIDERLLEALLEWKTERKVRTNLDIPEPTPLNELVPLDELRISPRFVQFLEDGEMDERYNGDRSAAIYATAGALYAAGFNDAQVLGYLSNYYPMVVATERRPHHDAIDWLWKYNCLTAQPENYYVPPKLEEIFRDVPGGLHEQQPLQGELIQANPTDLIPDKSSFEQLCEEAGRLMPGDNTKAVQLYMRAQDMGATYASELAEHYLKMWKKGDLEKDAKQIRKQERQLVSGRTQPVWVYLHEDGETPKDHVENFRAILTAHKVSIRNNLMTHEVEVTGMDMPALNQEKKNELQLYWLKDLATRYGMGVQRVREHLISIANENCYHPMEMMLDSATWDGHQRMYKVFDTIKTKTPEKRNLYMFKWCLSAIAVLRGLGPMNVSPRGVIVFAGKQMKGKTTWGELLVPDKTMFREGLHLNVQNKDSVKLIIGSWISELGELDSTFKKSELSDLKAFISRGQDVFRLPYDVTETQFKRRTVFIATVNKTEFLQDQTGNTRYWPIEVEGIDLDTMREMHNNGEILQFWKEIESYYDAGHQWWLTQEEAAELNEHNEDFTEATGIETLLQDYYDWDRPESEWSDRTTSKIAEDIKINIDQGQNQQRLRAALHKITGGGSKQKMRNGVRKYYWKVPPATIFTR